MNAAVPNVPEGMAASREPRVLVVDDEEHITELVAMGLGYNGFDVERAATGRDALDAIDRRRPDLIVLDVMLPDLDGFELTRRIRQSEGAGTRVPVIFLTAKDTTADKIQGLRLGSDDYVTKPFSIEELIERVKAVLRRASGAGPGEHKLSFADLELDEDTREVWRDGRLIELTPTGYKRLDDQVRASQPIVSRQLDQEAGRGGGPRRGGPGRGGGPGGPPVFVPPGTYAELRDESGAVVSQFATDTSGSKPELPVTLKA